MNPDRVVNKTRVGNSKTQEKSNRLTLREGLVLVGLVAAGVGVRLCFRDLPNFAPVAALALFSGYFFRSKLAALSVPLGVMLISDSVIGGYDLRIMFVVYCMLGLPIVWSHFLRQQLQVRRGALRRLLLPSIGLVLCSIMSSVLFFLVTNFACWQCYGMYDHSLAGLAHCYAMALPFFRYTLAGDMFFAVSLFGIYAMVVQHGLVRSPSASPASVQGV